MKLKVKINGKIYEAEKGEYILEVCRRNKVLVSTLCHHEGLSGLGSCRLCVVEVNEGSGNKIVVSCVYPLGRDCEVLTESEKIKAIRKTILSMLITKAPASDRLASLCQIYGVELPAKSAKISKAEKSKARVSGSKKERLEEACILCGLCVQTCASLGSGAISTVGRGISKKVSTPYGEPSADCVGCGSCAAVCPTRAIECSEEIGSRLIWGKKFTLLRCASCGSAFATKEEYALAFERAGTTETETILCESCRKKKSADVFASAFGGRTS
jgi:NADH dehydrogenase/NADH:ubiquinone oxidoreductase subunit G